MGIVDLAIDLAAVLGASRSVASKHVALRGRQLDRYGKASSIAAVLRSQQKAGQTVANDVKSSSGRGAAEGATADTPKHERAEDIFVPKDGISNARSGLEEVPTAAGDRTIQDTTTIESSGLSVSNRAATSQTPPPVSSIPPPTLRDLRMERQKEEQARINCAQSMRTNEGEAKVEKDEVPVGIHLEGLFRTSRGSRLSPLWKKKAQENAARQSVAQGVDLGAFRTSEGSNILREMENGEVDSQIGETSDQNPTPDNVIRTSQTEKAPSNKNPVTEAGIDPSMAEDSSQLESQKETDEIEVTTGPAPASEDATAAPTNQAEEPVTKEDASVLGELLGSAATTPKYELRESRVPSSRLGRIWNYSGLAAGMFAGAVSESFSRVTGGGGQGSLMLSPANMERLVAKLSKMRGAALKIGQMLSFQDSKMLPAPIQEVLQRVQDRADYMPAWQRDRVLTTNLGAEWRDLFDEFEDKPIAAASIGQVHRATLKSNGAQVAVKIQFPGVADSINSDLDNLGILLAATKLLPKGLYLNKTIDNARTELGWECDYEREAQCAQRYRDLLASEDDVFLVPKIYPEASGKQVLTMEFMDGVGVTRIQSFTQAQRDWIGTQILRLCLREITEFHFMQTDPNWTNFLYNADRDRLVLLDFGASREYPDRFISLYVRLLAAASRSDRETVKNLSEELGYLTGHESKAMLDAHIASVLTLAEPFLESAPEVYDFRDQTITERVKEQIPVMVRERLAPPPEETYSLHRKLSGAFLLCARLGSSVRCRELFEQSVAKSGIVQEGQV